MTRKTNFAFVIALMTGSCASVFAQGAAEAALTHALSTSVGSSVGNSLGRATNQLARRMGQQTSQTVQKSATPIKPGLQKTTATKLGDQKSAKLVSAAGSPAAQNGSLIQSIQGAEPIPACAGPAHDANANASSRKQRNCSSAASQDGTHYQSVITLPPAK